MYKKSLSLMLVAFLLQMFFVTSATAVVRTNEETLHVAKMKERIGAIHLERKRVTVTRRDGTKLKARVSEVREDSFVMTDEKTGAANEIRYDDVEQVKTKGNGLATSTKFLIGAGIVAAVVVVVLIVKPLGKSPFPKCNADRSNTPCDNS
jgi:hypothetical protein